ncbi:hypothetical protein Mgra_00008986 [Meloidogyne graminicola]|uniref:Uncharacterized protein n=1 Tax=Meloidogyne graminicola TaxID=189291 RepID=A0A8S9ZE71_9BILA|nr:hypothetical protein Mgra_00008986 [Meloidogyne graminicola]
MNHRITNLFNNLKRKELLSLNTASRKRILYWAHYKLLGCPSIAFGLLSQTISTDTINQHKLLSVHYTQKY